MSALRLPTGLLEEVRPFRAQGLSETTLLRGYSNPPTHVVRREPCACGGVLEQLRGQEIDQVVIDHNDTEPHLSWAAQREA